MKMLRFITTMLVVGLMLMVGIISLAQETYEFDDIGFSITYPDALMAEEDDGFFILYNDDLEMAFYLIDTDAIEEALEEAVGFVDDTHRFDVNAVEVEEIGQWVIYLYEFELDGNPYVVGAIETTPEISLFFELYVMNPQDEVWDLAFEVLFSLDGDGVGAPDPRQLDFGDVESVLQAYQLTGDLISIPDAFPPFVDTASEFEILDECIPPVPLSETLDETMVCGVLYVPENRTVSGSNIIELPVIVLLSHDEDSDSTLIYLEGGPGGSGTQSVADWAVTPYRQTHHIVMIDQRGTGYALPSLTCPEVAEGADESECYARLLSEGVDLTAYNSRENAADIAALINELGFSNNTLYGISYGTRLAMTVMRDHPEVLTSVIIDAVYPPEVGTGAEEALFFYQALQTMFADCEADPVCRSAYPDLEPRFFSMIDAINETPAVDIDLDTDEEFEITGGEFLGKLFLALYNSRVIPALPAALHFAAEGDYGFALLLMDYGPIDFDALDDEDDDEVPMTFEFGEGLDDAEAMYLSVECNEQLRFVDLRDYVEGFAIALEAGEIPESIIYNQFNLDLFVTCEQWESGVSAIIAAQPVGGNIPTLVFSGAYDPVTPPAWGELAASRLDDARFFNFPYSGHGLFDLECPANIAMQFLADPGAPIDDSCIARMTPNFYVP